jgi:hypothetical protein
MKAEYATYRIAKPRPPAEDEFECPRSNDVDKYVDTEYCDSFVKGAGCMHKRKCPPYQKAILEGDRKI